MNPKSKIILLYVGVVAISAAIIGLAMYLRAGMPKPELVLIENAGRQKEAEWFPIKRDLTGINQAGEQVKLSDLKGKVWIVAEFFAICPHCAQRNGAELRAIYEGEQQLRTDQPTITYCRIGMAAHRQRRRAF